MTPGVKVLEEEEDKEDGTYEQMNLNDNELIQSEIDAICNRTMDKFIEP